jgi:hypothetical protein
VAHKTGAITVKDLERVAVETTVQPKGRGASERRRGVSSGPAGREHCTNRPDAADQASLATHQTPLGAVEI